MARVLPVCVCIPVYKIVPDRNELLSFQQCLEVLKSHTIILVAPSSLDTSAYSKYFNSINIEEKIERFDDEFFIGIEGYNRLMLSKDFYIRFLNFKYIFIYQLDAYVFKDQLIEWCNKGFDYVGAPWTDPKVVKNVWKVNSRIGFLLSKIGIKPNPVGNGGLSLRKVSTFIRVLYLFNKKVSSWHVNANEDYFWSLYVPYYYPFFKRPKFEDAIKFSFEADPERCFLINNSTLPMGCHAWEKNQSHFWKSYIRS